MIWKERYQEWLNNPWLDPRMRDELNAIAANEDEIKARFGQMLSFGTGGLRGPVGAGTNRINRYTIRKVTQGLADWLTENSLPQTITVCIGFDARTDSPEFAADTAAVLAANGIHADLFETACPTPELSFAVRRLHAAAGVMITASHNPPGDNGYKVYGPDGVQILPESACQIGRYISETPFFWRRSFPALRDAAHQGLLFYLTSEIDREYLEAVRNALAGYIAAVPAEVRKSFPVCLTALHGVSGRYLQGLLQSLGFEPLIVAEQMDPDGTFPTLELPNPENEAAFAFAIDKCRRGHAAEALIILATDPDADRVACAVKDPDQSSGKSQSGQSGANGFRVLSGNQIAALLCDFILTQEYGHDNSTGGYGNSDSVRMRGSRSSINSVPPPEPLVAATFVTTGLVKAIAQKYGLPILETPPGFKYIGAAVEKAARRRRPFLFGCEDSCGYLIGDYVRDKDGILGAGLLALAAAWHASRGSSFLERLSELEREFGCYRESIESLATIGNDRHSAIDKDSAFERLRSKVVGSLREQGWQEGFAGMEMLEIRDYYNGKALDPQTGFSCNLEYSGERAIQIILSDNNHVTFRPSGTEPKFKIYIAAHADTRSEALCRQERLHREALSLIVSNQ